MISHKQMGILAFPHTSYDAIIADGAVRSGKTSIMTWAFVGWAMDNFSGQRFGICAKTVGSAEKNIIVPFLSMTRTRKRYAARYRRADKVMEVTRGGKTNVFEVFGGKDESSYALIQGRTLAGVLLDEVVLMPQSFVNQALARCSVDGARLWFSCNPGDPSHWFYQSWILRADEHNALYLRFAMTDNPSLSEKTLERYRSMYPPGVFYDRYVLGKWVQAEGLIYPMWADALIDAPPPGQARRHVLSLDYGTMNAFAALDCAERGDGWIVEREYYYSGRDEGKTKTDEEYAQALDAFTADLPKPVRVIIDPSAASFIALLQKRGHRYKVTKADNDVLDGIRETATALQTGKVKVCRACKNWIVEAQSYVWDESAGEDRPVKENDHAMDALRYFCKTMGVARPKAAHLTW